MTELETAVRIIEVIPYLNRSIVANARRTLPDGWFTLVHTRVMAFIRRTGGCSLGDLADFRGVSLPTMSKMVSSLVDKGLVTREPDPANRRAVIIRLTPEGDRLYLEVLSQLQRQLASDLAGLSRDQRTMIVNSLELLADLIPSSGEIRQHLPLPVGEEEDEA